MISDPSLYTRVSRDTRVLLKGRNPAGLLGRDA